MSEANSADLFPISFDGFAPLGGVEIESFRYALKFARSTLQKVPVQNEYQPIILKDGLVFGTNGDVASFAISEALKGLTIGIPAEACLQLLKYLRWFDATLTTVWASSQHIMFADGLLTCICDRKVRGEGHNQLQYDSIVEACVNWINVDCSELVLDLYLLSSIVGRDLDETFVRLATNSDRSSKRLMIDAGWASVMPKIDAFHSILEFTHGSNPSEFTDWSMWVGLKNLAKALSGFEGHKAISIGVEKGGRTLALKQDCEISRLSYKAMISSIKKPIVAPSREAPDVAKSDAEKALSAAMTQTVVAPSMKSYTEVVEMPSMVVGSEEVPLLVETYEGPPSYKASSEPEAQEQSEGDETPRSANRFWLRIKGWLGW